MVIVGGGIVGLAAAQEMVSQSKSVVNKLEFYRLSLSGALILLNRLFVELQEKYKLQTCCVHQLF